MGSRLLEKTYDRVSAIAQCRDPLTIMEIVDQTAASVGAARHLMVRLAAQHGERNQVLAPWISSAVGEAYVRVGFDLADPLQTAMARLRRPLTDATVAREEREDASRLTRFLSEAGVHGFVAVPVLRNSLVIAAFSLFFETEIPPEAGWVAGIVAPPLFEQVSTISGPAFDGDRGRPSNPLSPRELECLIWSADGKTSWEISEILNVSERTVNAHLGRAIRKLGVVSRTQAAAEAIRRGLIQ